MDLLNSLYFVVPSCCILFGPFDYLAVFPAWIKKRVLWIEGQVPDCRRMTFKDLKWLEISILFRPKSYCIVVAGWRNQVIVKPNYALDVIFVTLQDGLALKIVGNVVVGPDPNVSISATWGKLWVIWAPSHTLYLPPTLFTSFSWPSKTVSSSKLYYPFMKMEIVESKDARARALPLWLNLIHRIDLLWLVAIVSFIKI